MNLPRPSANKKEYGLTLERGFHRFPARKENYEKYLQHTCGAIMETVPIKMDYEVGSRCNFRCQMCLMSEISKKRPPDMKFTDFKRSIEEQYGLVEVKLQGMGEPLLNPDFFQMAELAVSRDIWVRTATNASLLHIGDNYKRLIDSGIGEIQISMDGATRETFEKIRSGSNFEQIVSNATLLNSYASEKGEAWRTSCWMLVQRDNYSEMEQVLELAAEMRFTRLTYSMAISSWGVEEWKNINAPREVKEILTDDLAGHLIFRGRELGVEVTFWDGKDKYVCDEKKDKLCSWLFSRAFISADMKIVPCCVICDSDTCCLGDAKHFMDEWNNGMYRTIREQHMRGELPAMCRECYEIQA